MDRFDRGRGDSFPADRDVVGKRLSSSGEGTAVRSSIGYREAAFRGRSQRRDVPQNPLKQHGFKIEGVRQALSSECGSS